MPDRENAASGVRVPDIREEAFRQSLAVARSAHAETDRAFIEAIGEPDIGWGTAVPPVAS